MIFGISIFRILLVVISVFFIIVELKKINQNKTRGVVIKAIFSILTWCVVFTFSFFPDAAHWVSKKFGLGENLNTLIFAGFVLMFIVMLNLTKKIDRLDSSLSEMVRVIALKDLEK